MNMTVDPLSIDSGKANAQQMSGIVAEFLAAATYR